MVSFKTQTSVYIRLLFLYLILFPFGQLLRLNIDTVFGRLIFYPTDLIVGISFVIFLFTKNKKYPEDFNFLKSFYWLCAFSLIFSTQFFAFSQIYTGIFYLIRFISYTFLFVIVWNITEIEKNAKSLIYNSLILVGSTIATFGFIQYFFLPDLRGLYELGWDDHYFRLASTLLDPAFTGIILVFTIILLLTKITKEKIKMKSVFLVLYLLVALALTYSRSSYIAFAFGLLTLFVLNSKRKIFIFLVTVLVISLPFLPKHPSEGVNLARRYSIEQKFTNYSQSVDLIKRSPVFGLGFNNVCIARQKFLKETNFYSHSCSGLDNSFLFIIATTGIVGLLIFCYLIFNLWVHTSNDYIGKAFLSTLVALAAHGMFTNTVFYAWVMGWLAILAGLSRRKAKE